MKKMPIIIAGLIISIGICGVLILLNRPSDKGTDGFEHQATPNQNEAGEFETEEQEEEETKPEVFLDFEVIEIRLRGSEAGDDVCKVTKTENGVLLQHYRAISYWDTTIGDTKEEITPIHETEGDMEMLKRAQRIAGAYNIAEWDGFNESEPNVLDGTMLIFYAKLADGTEINASGSNAYPKNFSEFQRAIRNLMG